MLVLDFLVGRFGNKAPPIPLDPLDVSGFTAVFILHKILHPAQKKTLHVSKKTLHVSCTITFLHAKDKTVPIFTFCSQPCIVIYGLYIDCEQI